MKIHLFSAAVLAIATSAAYGQSQPVQWRVEDGGNGHWYVLRYSDAINWQDASVAANAEGGHLATIGSSIENQFVFVVGLSGWRDGWAGPWLGGVREQGAFQWVDGSTWSFVEWDCQNPSNSQGIEDCLHFGINPACPTWPQPSPTWNDAYCGSPMSGYIIEWSADCNNDGIVDYGQCRDGSLPDYNGNNIPDCCETGTPCEVGSYPVQWRVEDGGNGHWYAKVAVSPLPTTIAAMQGFAASRGADLASIASSGENERILSLLGSIGAGESYSAWIGLYRPTPGDPWRWTDGSTTTWAGWGGTSCTSGPYPNDMSFPGELGTVIYRQNCGLVWDDSPTEWIQNPPPWWGGVAGMTLVLEWTADCNNDGIVDYGQILSGQVPDSNSNGVPDTCECFADINHSGAVNGVDLALVLSAWGTNGNGEFQTDISNDGIVNGQDLAFVLGAWGPCP
jgi:hypothetical protein